MTKGSVPDHALGAATLQIILSGTLRLACAVDCISVSCGCCLNKEDTLLLIICPACQAEVSDTVRDCDQCGRQLLKPKRSKTGKAVKYSFVLFNVVMACWLTAEFWSASGSDADVGAKVLRMATGWVFGDAILGLLVLLTRPRKSADYF